MSSGLASETVTVALATAVRAVDDLRNLAPIATVVSRPPSGTPLRGQQVLSPGGWVGEAERRVLDLFVGGGEATTVLSQVFLP